MKSYKTRLQQYDAYLSELIRDYGTIATQTPETNEIRLASQLVQQALINAQKHLRQHFSELSDVVTQSKPKRKQTPIQTTYPIRKLPYVPSATRGMPFRVQDSERSKYEHNILDMSFSQESDYDRSNPGEKAVQLERRQIRHFNQTVARLRRVKKINQTLV